MNNEDLKSYIKSYYLDRKMTYTKLDKHDRAIGVLLEENKQLKEEKPYLYTNTEWEDILEYQGKSYIELDRYKKREKEIMDKYFYQSKYASEMEDKYITINSILTELEEFLTKIVETGAGIEKLTCSNILVYLKELKEKYK